MTASIILTVILISILSILLIALYLVQTDLVLATVAVRRKFVSIPDKTITFMTLRNTDIIEYLFIKSTKTTNVTIYLIPIDSSICNKKTIQCTAQSCIPTNSDNDSRDTIQYYIELECGRTGVIAPCIESRQLQAYDIQIETNNETVLDVVARIVQV